MSDDNDINPATGLPMVGDFDSGGNPYGFNNINPATGLPIIGGNAYGCNNRFKGKNEQAKTPCTDDEFANRLLGIVLTFSFFFILFVIACSLK